MTYSPMARLFKPDAAIYYRDRLAAAGCPAAVLLNQGIHASAEALYLTAPKIIAGINDTRVYDGPVDDDGVGIDNVMTTMLMVVVVT